MANFIPSTSSISGYSYLSNGSGSEQSQSSGMKKEMGNAGNAPQSNSTNQNSELENLLKLKLDKPDYQLTSEQSIDLLMHCIERGTKETQKAKGKEIVAVIGNTGAGKSTFINYLYGCEMLRKSPKELGVTGTEKIVVVKSRSAGG